MMSQHARTGFKSLIERESEAISVLRVQSEERPITIIGNEKVVDGFEDSCLQQAINTKLAPGVTDVFLNPDAHMGYGAPVGSVLVSPTHIYPGPVGVDIKCSMSLLQTNVPADAIEDRRVRRALIQAICQRVPTGTGRGQRPAVKSRQVSVASAKQAACEGASKEVLSELGIPAAWAEHCEDAFHRGPDGTVDALTNRFERLQREGCYPISRIKQVSWGLMEEAITLANAKLFQYLPMLRCDALLITSDCKTTTLPSFLIAVREVSGTPLLLTSFDC